MAQPALQRQFGSDRPSQENLDWSTQQMMQHGDEYSQAPMADAMSGFAAPTQRSMWGRNAVNNTLMWERNNNLQMESLASQQAVPLGPNSHLSYTDPLMSSQNIGDKLGTMEYNVDTSWNLSATAGNQQRQVSVFNGSEFGTTSSSVSPKSFFSEPSDGGQAYGTANMANKMSPNQAWAGFGSESPQPIKQSQSPYMNRPMASTYTPQQDRQLQSMDLNMMTSPEQGQHSIQWGPNYSVMPSGLPYFQEGMVEPGSFDQDTNHMASPYAGRAATEFSDDQFPDNRTDTPVIERDQGNSTVDSQAQREEEDRLLVEGKKKGLTYKEIRKQMRHPVAESTLRGRYRSIVKTREKRVRKPIWREKDIELLKDVVTAELERLEEGGRALNEVQRLGRISWKKVAEYIVQNGGSYHFGNSTCKKKWTEISQC